jgi:hypothetical protein
MTSLRRPKSDTITSPMTVAADCSMVLMMVMVGVAAGFSAMMARRSRSVDRRVTVMVFSFSCSHITDLRQTRRAWVIEMTQLEMLAMLPTWKKILERPFVVWLIHST